MADNPVFMFSKIRHDIIEYWEGDDGRWYWHKKVNGRVVDSGSYALRRSLRRALRRMFGEPVAA